MTSPLAVIGLTFRTTDIQTADLGIFFEITRGLNEPPTVRGEDVLVPGRPGRIAIAGGFEADVLTIELEGKVTAGGEDGDEADQRSAFRVNAKVVRALFDPTLDPGALVALLEDGTTATIQARAMPTQLWDQPADVHADVSIELQSVDPDWVITGP